MSIRVKIRGIIGTILQWDKTSGPQIKSNSGVLEVRNSLDSGFAIIRGETPVAANDLATKGYADGIVSGGCQVAEITVGNSAGNFDTTVTVSANTRVLKCVVAITAAYDGSATITVGSTASPAQLQASTDNDPSTIDEYSVDIVPGTNFAGGVFRVVLGGTPTVGAAIVQITYCETVDT